MGIDWTSAWAAGQHTSTSAPVAVATTAAASTPAVSPIVAAEAKAASTSEAAPASSASPASSSAAPAATTDSSSSSNDVVSSVLNSVEEIALKALGVVSAGINAVSDAQDVWVGTGGPYTMELINNAGEDLYLVCWGSAGSWINSIVPLITLSIPSGGKSTLSFKDGASGALGAFYSDTKLVNGQLSNTWVEFTMGNYGVFDVSREVNMNGHSVEVVGPSCTSNMDTCVFKCTDSSVSSCEFDYELVNCDTGSQKGAQFGTYKGAASGGCGGLGEAASMVATFT